MKQGLHIKNLIFCKVFQLMVNSDELLYVVDEFDERVEPQPRHKVFKEGLWRRTCHVWIYNKSKKFLCQRRSLKKDRGAGLWEPAAAGHMGPDDNYYSGAVREVWEETGLSIDPSELKFLKIYKDHDKKEFTGVFYCELDVESYHIKMEEGEVDEVKMVSINTLKKHLIYSWNAEKWVRHGYEREIFAALS